MTPSSPEERAREAEARVDPPQDPDAVVDEVEAEIPPAEQVTDQ